jgi:hypothetical protein
MFSAIAITYEKSRRWVEISDGFPIRTQRDHHKVTTRVRSIG